jgi:D-serine deaminase-like pyridoxal phosphate-dependent protein
MTVDVRHAGEGLLGSDIELLDTPSLLVNLDVFESNVRRCMKTLASVRVRPHLKTAKSPTVARVLLQAGASGICVAKLSEAEVMLAAGVDDILITTEIAGAVKTRRLGTLMRSYPSARLRLVVDSWDGALAVDAAVPFPIAVLIDVNVAQDRCGVDPAQARALADRIRGLANLQLVGVQGYEGNLQHVRSLDERRRLVDVAMERLRSAVRALRAAGYPVPVVTTGGTGTASLCAQHDVVTEVQPGSFVLMDTDYLATEGVPYRSALTVVSTVISCPSTGRAVVDAGLKTLSDDSGPGRVIDAPGWTYAHAGDEHGVLTPAGVCARRDLRVGDRVTLVPSHIDTTVNLHDALCTHRMGKIEGTWEIMARGKVQ